MEGNTLAFLAVFSLVVSSACTVDEGKQEQESKVCFKDRCIAVEVATTPEERARGLMFRESLERGRGMLFIYDREGVYSFWMKNTLIPLDIVWINSSRDIVYINRDTQPCKTEPCASVNPGVNALYVLEVNGGVAEGLNLTLGEKASISI